MTDSNLHKSSDNHRSCDNADARAARLRRLRNLANLSRKELCQRSGVKPDTLIGWEVARHGGLTENGAKKVLECVAAEGVQCTLNWLLHETGPSPVVLPRHDTVFSNTTQHNDFEQKNEDKRIADDLILFNNQYPDAVSYRVEDDAMSPQYLENDYVAGVKRYKGDISKVIGYDCIVQLAEGQTLLRCLRAGSNKNKYTLLCCNTKTTASSPTFDDVELLFAAPVIWIRRKNPET